VKGQPAYQLELSQLTQVPRERSYFDRWDLITLLVLTAVAFVLRFFSPIMPDFFVNGFQGPVITDCVQNTPINAQGDPGTLCGLTYPFNRGYPDQNKVLSPPNGQVFDEIYFPVDAQIDFKNTRCSSHSIYCPYFDPEPPLAKLFIGAGMWGYGWYRATFQGASGAGEIVIDSQFAEEAERCGWLSGSSISEHFEARLKGLRNPVRVARIVADML